MRRKGSRRVRHCEGDIVLDVEIDKFANVGPGPVSVVRGRECGSGYVPRMEFVVVGYPLQAFSRPDATVVQGDTRLLLAREA
jgi:hypothetical protein